MDYKKVVDVGISITDGQIKDKFSLSLNFPFFLSTAKQGR